MFFIKESFRWIRRAKLSFLFSLLSTSISILLIYLSFFSFYLADYYQTKLKEQVQIHVFLLDSLDDNSLSSLKENLQAEAFVKELEFISKEKAAENFIAETGEDFREVLDYNPLPASFLISLNKDYLVKTRLDSIITLTGSMPGVEDVTYNADIFEKILALLQDVRKYIWAAAVLLILLAFYIVYSTLRLIIHNREEEIETMKLVGASVATIKLPILISGIFIGTTATLLTGGILYGLYFVTNNLLDFSNIFIYFEFLNLFILMAVGPLIGLVCSLLATRNISLRVY